MSEKLTDFAWDDSQTLSFFGQEVEPQIDEVLPTEEVAEEEDKTEPKPKPKPEVEEEEEDMTFFENEIDLSENSEDVEEEIVTPAGEDTYYKDLYLDLKEKGLIRNVELEEDEVVDADKLLEIQEQEIEIEVANRVETWAKENINDEAASLLKFLKEGGTVKDFISVKQEVHSVPVGNIEDPAYQEKVVRYQLTKEGWDSEEVEDRIDFLSQTGKLASKASAYEAKLKKEAGELESRRVADLQRQRKEAEERAQAYRTSLHEIAQANPEISGFKITPSKANKLIDNITRPTVELPDGRKVTKIQSQMMEVYQDPEKLLLLSNLLDNDFDFTPLAKKAVDKNTKNIKKHIENRKAGAPRVPGSSTGGIQTLADLLG